MMKGGEYAKITTRADNSEKPSVLKNLTQDSNTDPFVEVDKIESPKLETEFIENGENTEDARRLDNKDLFFADVTRTRKDSHEPGVPLVQGQIAVILAGVFAIIAIVGYVVLLSWRRFLE